jgi:hypothetical protein
MASQATISAELRDYVECEKLLRFTVSQFAESKAEQTEQLLAAQRVVVTQHRRILHRILQLESTLGLYQLGFCKDDPG